MFQLAFSWGSTGRPSQQLTVVEGFSKCSSRASPLALSTHALLASLLFLELAEHTPALRPLHLLSPLPRMPFPLIVSPPSGISYKDNFSVSPFLAIHCSHPTWPPVPLPCSFLLYLNIYNLFKACYVIYIFICKINNTY